MSAGLLLLGLVEGYIRGRSYLVRRSIRKILGITSMECSILPTQFAPDTPDRNSVRYSSRDVIAITYLTDTIKRVGIMATFPTFGDPLHSIGPDICAIGGWAGNPVTAMALEAFCPGFKINDREAVDVDFNKISYECGPYEFRNEGEWGHGFILRLQSDKTGLSGVILALFGHVGIETCAAAYALTQQYKSLPKHKGSMLVAVPVLKGIGPEGTRAPFIDLTEFAFAAQSGISP